MPNISTLSVDLVDPLTSPELAQWLMQSSDSTIFHTAGWARVLAESYGYRPVCLVLSSQGSLRACLPVMEVDSALTGKRGVCLSFSDYCGAIASDGDEFRLLFDSLVEYGRSRNWRYVEFRGEVFLDGTTPRMSYVHHVIEVSADEKLMLSRLRKSTLRSIQKAIKEGVRVEISQTLEGVLGYYHLHCLTRRRQGLPPQPKTYFLKLHEHVIGQKLGFTGLALQGEDAVAGLICLHFGRNAIYKYGASAIEYQHLRANNLLFWEMLKRCGRDSYDLLSLGRTDRDNEGLIVFKDGWGGQRSNLYYYRYDLTKNKFLAENDEKRVVACAGFFRRLPVGMLKILGRMAYRHFG